LLQSSIIILPNEIGVSNGGVKCERVEKALSFIYSLCRRGLVKSVWA